MSQLPKGETDEEIQRGAQQSKANKIWKWNATPTRGKESKERNVREKACERQRGGFATHHAHRSVLLLGKSESPQSSDEDMHRVEELTLWGGPR